MDVERRQRGHHAGFTKTDVDQMVVRYESGLSLSAIASDFGCCQGSSMNIRAEVI